MTGWWRFDEGSSPFAFDSAGAPNNVQRPVSLPSCNGRVRGAALVGGSSIYAKDAPELNVGTGDFSIVVWVKAPPATLKRAIVGKGTDTTGYALFLDSKGHLGFRMNATTIVDTTGPDVADNQWHLVAVTVERSPTNIGTLWVLNKPAHSFSFTPTLPTASLDTPYHLYIGSGSSTSPLGGCLDELQLYKGLALPNTEIQSFYDEAAMMSQTGTTWVDYPYSCR